MFGSDVLDVAIGVTLLFLFASLICTAIQETIESAMRWRAMDLERGIREILQTEYAVRGENLSGDAATRARKTAQDFYSHPFIYALYSGDYASGSIVRGGNLSGAKGRTIMPRAARMHLPTYIPSATFAATLIDLIRLEAGPDAPLTFESLKAGAGKIGNPRLQKAALAAVLDAEGNVDRLRKTFEGWFDAAMDRVSGWYKRRTQAILLMIGLATACLFNIDAIQVARHLANDRTYRDAVIAEAGKADAQARTVASGQNGSQAAPLPVQDPSPAGSDGAASKSAKSGHASRSAARDGLDVPPSPTFTQARADLERNGFILGWPAPQRAEAARGHRSVGAATLFMVFGWIITALAVSLGAPFWFDVLNKFMVVRSTVKPAEKSGREASKDRAAPPQ